MTPDGAVAASPDPSASLSSVAWERIQLVLRVRGDGLDPARLFLSAVDPPEPRAPMPPTHHERADDELRLRFNVMLAAGQQPLAAGRWALTQDGSPVRLRPTPVLDAEEHGRVFAYRGGRYAVTPTLDPASGGLVLEVSLHRRPRQHRSPRRRLTRWARKGARPRQRIFDALVRFYRWRTARTGRRILFTSDSRAALSGNLVVIHDRMIERGLQREYELASIFKPSIAARRGWRDRWRLPRLLARADVILLDDYQPIIYRLPPDPDVRVVQLWHASGAFKTVGYSRIGKPGGPSPFARRHKNYTHAIVSGRHDVPFYAEAFGLPEERVVPTGIPRMDRFFDEAHRARGRQQALRAFPAIDGRTVILLAPTFRGAGPRSAHYDWDRLDFAALHAACEEKDAVLIVKMHPFVRAPAPIPDRLRDRLIDGSTASIDVNDLLFAVDLLITDYSSIVFEFSTLLRPMLFFAYDLEEYVASRDFYVPFEEFVPGRIVRTVEELVEAIRNDAYEAEKVPAFASRHFDHLDGTATDRVIDDLILAR